MTKETLKQVDDYVDKIKSSRGKYDVKTYVLSILSDVEETSDPVQRNEWISKAKYVISKHLGGK